MEVSVICPVYPPEPIISAQTSSQLTDDLVLRGHDVTVITSFPNRPAGRLFPGYKLKLYSREWKSGFLLIRCFSTFSRQSRLLSRFLQNITFGISSGLFLLFSRKPNVIYSNSWPIFATGIITLVARWKNIPLVISIQDIYPESLSIQGRLNPGSLLFRGLFKVDSWISQQAQGVITISGKFYKIYRDGRGVKDKNLFTVHNWVDEDKIITQSRFNNIRTKNQLTKKDFILVYGGNIGVASGIETLINAMCLTPRKVKAIIAGDGSNLESCKKIANELAPNKIFFHNPWLEEETSSVLSAADVLILPTYGRQSMVSVPSKLITYMFAARPVIALAYDNSDVADIIKCSGCGWVIQPDNPELLAETINRIAALPSEELNQKGLDGHNYALANYSRAKNVPRVIEIIEHVAR